MKAFEDINKCQEAQAGIRASEIRYRRLFEAARDGILIVDPGTRKITDANPFMTELLGYAHQELVAKELWEIGLLKDEEASRAAFRELQEKHFIRYEDLPLQDMAGHRRDVEFVSNLYDEDGREVIQCNIRDITERKQLEAALRGAAEFDHAVVTSMGEGLYTLDDRGLVTFMNPAAEKFFGWKLEELRGKRMHDMTHYKRPDGSPFPAEECAGFQVLRHGKTFASHEDVFIRKDGTFFDVAYTPSPLREGDKIKGLVVVFSDLSERKQTEKALRESEKKYRTLFDSIDEGFCTVEMLFDANDKPVDYRFLEINPSFEKQTGIQNALGRRMREIAPLHEDHWFEIYGRIALTGEPARFENPATQLRRWYDVYAFRIGEPQERKVAILFKDITERKRAEEALLSARNEIARHALELEKVVAERTAQLRETISELKAFSYSVSHDMRAPLRAMQGFAGILVDEYTARLDGPGLNYLRQIMRSAVRLDRLIQDVLSYSGILHAELPMERVDLDRLVHDIIETYPNEGGIKPEIKIKGTLPKVVGNQALLTQCVSNLLGNGIKFVSPGTTPRVEISAEAVGDAWIRVWFKDNGIGIAPENHDRIFSMFERLHPTTQYEGTGIGLTIVRKAIERMGAQMGFESEPGKGSKFWIELKKG